MKDSFKVKINDVFAARNWVDNSVWLILTSLQSDCTLYMLLMCK